MATEEPCKCHQNFAYIAPTHSGHCCFVPASQTCHVEQVAEWESKKRAALGLTAEQEEERT